MCVFVCERESVCMCVYVRKSQVDRFHSSAVCQDHFLKNRLPCVCV